MGRKHRVRRGPRAGDRGRAIMANSTHENSRKCQLICSDRKQISGSRGGTEGVGWMD